MADTKKTAKKAPASAAKKPAPKKEAASLFDKETVDLIKKAAKEHGIPAGDVTKVLSALPNENGDTKGVTRAASANREGALMSLLDEDQDEIADRLSAASGVTRGSTGKILLLAAPFLLKYLFSGNNSSASSGMGMGGMGSMGMLGSLLGGGQQQSSMGMLGSLLGGGQQQSSMGMLGSLLGGGQTQQQQSSMGMLGSLLGASQPQPQQSSGMLGSLFGGSQQQPQQVSVSNNGNGTVTLDTQTLMSLLNNANSGNQQANTAMLQSLASGQQTTNASSNSLLSSLLGGGQTQQQQSSSGGVLNSIFNLLGDNG